MPALEQLPETDTERPAHAFALPPLFDPAEPVRPETLSRTLRAVADMLDGRPPAEDGVPHRVDPPGTGEKGPAPNLAKLARGYLRHRRQRERQLPDLFADPAWDLLLDLFAATMERRRVSVSSACVAAAVPPTTALRWIGILEARGLIGRIADPKDRRVTYLRLNEATREAIAEWLVGLSGFATWT